EGEGADGRENLIRAGAAADDGEDRLRRLIMDPNDVSFWQASLDLVDEPAGRTPPPDVDAIVAKAMNERYDVGRARNDGSNAAANVEVLANPPLPHLTPHTAHPP